MATDSNEPIVGDDGADESTGAAAETSTIQVTPKGVYVTPRRILIAVAIVLALVLAALVLYLLLVSNDTTTGQVDAKAVAGIQAEVVIDGPGRGKNPKFERPMGAAWSENGREIFVADTVNNRICVFDRRGRFLREFGQFGVAKPLPGVQGTWDPGDLNYPTDVAVDDENNVYVADFYNDSISVFSEEGRFLRRFPDPTVPTGKGSSGADGAGIAVTAVDVDGEFVYATDTYQIFVFTRDGKFVRQFGKPGLALGSLDHPNGVKMTEGGELIVADSNNSRLVAYSPLGKPLWVTGGRLVTGKEPEKEIDFILPRGVTSDGASVFVVDALAHQMIALANAGEITGRYGARGTGPAEFNFPNDVDWSDGRFVVADRENNRVQVVRLVEE